MKSLLIIGAGGHGRVVKETAEICGYNRIDFLDDNNPKAVGKLDQLERIVLQYDDVIVSIGDNEIRKELINRLQHIGSSLGSIIHPRAFVASSAKIGAGSIVLPGAVIHSNVQVGIGCIISIGVLIDHDTIVEDFTHLNTGVVVKAGMTVSGKIDAGITVM